MRFHKATLDRDYHCAETLDKQGPWPHELHDGVPFPPAVGGRYLPASSPEAETSVTALRCFCGAHMICTRSVALRIAACDLPPGLASHARNIRRAS